MRNRLLFAAAFFLVVLPVFLLPADPVRLEAQAAQGLLRDAGLGAEGALEVAWPWTAPEERTAREDVLRIVLRLPPDRSVESPAPGLLVAVRDPGAPPRRVVVAREDGRLVLREGDAALAERPLGSRWSLVPPIAAILLAFLTRNVLMSLGFGVLLGVGLSLPSGLGVVGWVGAFLRRLFGDILWHDILSDSFHLSILGFVLVLSVTIAIVTRMGGIEGIVRGLLRFAASSRSVQAVAYFMGLGIFFDDYANTIVVGNSCKPLFDSQHVSRAKLAYVVDSTAAPVAGIAVLSTWVAYQISTYAPQLPTIGMDPGQGYAVFLETIPYRFYCMFALLMVGMVVFLKRDFGPMYAAERLARSGRGKELHDPTSVDTARIEPWPKARPHWLNGVVPIAAMVFGTFALILWHGSRNVDALAAGGDAAAQEAISSGGMSWLRAVLGATDSAFAIFQGSVLALGLALILALGRRLLPPAEVVRTAIRGSRTLFEDAILVLILAWSIGRVCTDLDTAAYLVAVFQDLMSPHLLPLILFVTACFVAFATGSSWTTMAILQPNVVLLAWQLGESVPELGGHGLLILSIGAVLEGAIFGDHCSPISDTTVLSSAASGCVHIEHVRTQAPYAMVTAFAALLLAYFPVAWFGIPWWVGLLLGGSALLALLLTIGRDPDRGCDESAKAG